MKFKVGDKVTLSEKGIEDFSPNNWGRYYVPLSMFNGERGVIDEIRTDNNGDFEIYVTNSAGRVYFGEDQLALVNLVQVGDEYEAPTPNQALVDLLKTDHPVSALDKQVSGNHYKDCGIQPIEYIHANGLDYFQGNVVKYVTRHKDKAGRADIEKAIHYLELILELQYGD